ncbi:MAG TPA: PA0069 family radical SAM protein [Mariprofundaceae bacterium]|nr:PA0069 family radical SAM protein [Mariprofundaceae bacterium]
MLKSMDRINGRGATVDTPGRFARQHSEAVDDGWWQEDEPAPRTRLHVDTAKSVINRNDSPDVPFGQSINPYRGCEHGCPYCFARPSHAYLDLSPGIDFETEIFYKPDAPALLRRELSAKSYRPEPIALGINTDAWQPVEKHLGLTRQLLSVLAEFGAPVSIVTKSALIVRDIDILAGMAERHTALVLFSITTLDGRLARTMEPRAATPARRLQAMRKLSEAGIPVGVLVAPVIPHLNDHELESILEAARDHGARGAGYSLLRLPYELTEVFPAWLREHFPDRAEAVMRQLSEMRGGRLYESNFGVRMHGRGVRAELLSTRFAQARRRYGLDQPLPELTTEHFHVPGRMVQPTLF